RGAAPTGPAQPGAARGAAPAPPSAPGPQAPQRGNNPFAIRPIFVLTGDGNLHQVNINTGEEVIPPMKFLPPNGKPYSLAYHNNVIYTITGQGCGGNPNSVYSLDLDDPAKTVRYWRSGSGGLWGIAGPAIERRCFDRISSRTKTSTLRARARGAVWRAGKTSRAHAGCSRRCGARNIRRSSFRSPTARRASAASPRSRSKTVMETRRSR